MVSKADMHEMLAKQCKELGEVAAQKGYYELARVLLNGVEVHLDKAADIRSGVLPPNNVADFAAFRAKWLSAKRKLLRGHRPSDDSPAA